MRFILEPGERLRSVTGEAYPWRTDGPSPRFRLRPQHGLYPGGWVLVRTDLEGEPREALNPMLLVRTRDSSGSEASVPLTPLREGRESLVQLPHGAGISELALSPADRAARFRLSEVSIRPVSKPELAVRLTLPVLSSVLRQAGRPKKAVNQLRGILGQLRAGGLPALRHGLRKKFVFSYDRWVQLYGTLSDDDRRLIRARIDRMAARPKISVILPVYNVDEPYLRACIESVRKQLYPDWELCIADDRSPKPHVRRVLEEYAAADPRIRVVFREKNGHIVAASNSAIELATGEYFAFLDHDDELTEHALYLVAEEALRHPDAVLIYSDEDKIDENGRRYSPHFKPEWNPDLFHSLNLVTHLATYRAELVRSLGGLRPGLEGSQDYDLAARVAERAGPGQIRRIPHVLYHWRAIPGSTALHADEKDYAHVAARRAVQEHLERQGIQARVVPGNGAYNRVVYPVPEPAPLVSLIVPTRDRVDLLRQTLRGVLEETDYPNIEVLVVDNRSRESETLRYLEEIARDPRVAVVPYDAPFNYAAMNNHAVGLSKGSLVGLLNNDLKVMAPGWLREMVSHALRPEVGAVGAKLYYPNDTIQHAGVILGVCGIAGHAHRGLPRSNGGFVGRLVVTHDLSAVTAACLVVRRSVFDEVGGLDAENFAVAYNDIDFCLRLVEKGYRNVYTPFAELYHFESATRGSDTTAENLPRFLKEQEAFRRRWGSLLKADPCYSPNLTLDREDFMPAFPPRADRPWKTEASHG